MRTRSFWALDEADEAIVDRVAAGVGRDAARLLAYLLLRAEREDDPATSVHLQVGTGLNRTAITDAMARLESRGLVERSDVQRGDSGRPRTGWRPCAGLEQTVGRTYESHATALLDIATDRGRATADQRGVSDESTSTSPINIALNWHPNALQAPIYAGIAAEWYEEFDVGVRLEHHDGSQRALERVSSGAADLAVAGAATIVRARAAGAPVVPLAVLYQRAMTVLYTVREVFGEPLDGVDQLEGRRIGMPPKSETRLLGQLFLSQTAFADDVDIVDTNGEERDVLRRGEADVVTGSFTDPQQLEREGLTVDALVIADNFPIYGPTIVGHEAALADRSPVLERALAGTAGGWAAARNDPEPAADRIAAESDESPARIRRTFERAASEFGESDTVREHGWGWHRREMWDRLRTALEQGALLRDSA